MNTVCQNILQLAETLPEGESLSAKALLHLGTRETVDQALSRLVRRGHLLRAGRGTYVRQVQTKFGLRPPSPAKLIEALAAKTGETITSNGAAAANALGLTPQVPIKQIYLTSGRSRTFTLGSQVVELQHAARWQTALAESKAGQAIRALGWLGEHKAGEVIPRLRQQLMSSEVAELLQARSVLPTWMAREVSRMADHV
jgi:DNA-binding GntR family transcriptional regulator